jgi:hypothetical protein
MMKPRNAPNNMGSARVEINNQGNASRGEGENTMLRLASLQIYFFGLYNFGLYRLYCCVSWIVVHSIT